MKSIFFLFTIIILFSNLINFSFESQLTPLKIFSHKVTKKPSYSPTGISNHNLQILPGRLLRLSFITSKLSQKLNNVHIYLFSNDAHKFVRSLPDLRGLVATNQTLSSFHQYDYIMEIPDFFIKGTYWLLVSDEEKMIILQEFQLTEDWNGIDQIQFESKTARKLRGLVGLVELNRNLEKEKLNKDKTLGSIDKYFNNYNLNSDSQADYYKYIDRLVFLKIKDMIDLCLFCEYSDSTKAICREYFKCRNYDGVENGNIINAICEIKEKELELQKWELKLIGLNQINNNSHNSTTNLINAGLNHNWILDKKVFGIYVSFLELRINQVKKASEKHFGSILPDLQNL